MNNPAQRSVNKATDSIQQRLTDYACDLKYENLTPEAIHAAKASVIDTLGALIGGFFGEPCRIARNLAAQMPSPGGATVIGTRMRTTPDMAAFVNATTARYVEINDIYHWPGSYECHPSDSLTPVLAAAEHAQLSGREFILGVVLAYEVFLRFADVLHHQDFDNTAFGGMAAAVAAGKLLGLSADQLSHCISMAVVPNNILRQVRLSDLTMFKVVAAGQAGRAGIFAALLARAGMEGPHLPFEGKAGWCDHVARERFTLDTMGGNGTSFKILDARMKHRPSSGATIPSILAAEKLAPSIKNIGDIKQVTAEVYQMVMDNVGTGKHRWNPDSRETADHSAPYTIAATLMDGTVTRHTFDEAHLWNPDLRALMQKIEVVENPEFTKAYAQWPQQHHTRITVVTNSGERLVGETGGGKDDLAERMSDGQVADKFRGLTEEFLGAKRVTTVLERLWHLDEMKNVADIPAALIF